VLFHCAAGKDRTGAAAALVLALLGADRDAICNDYAASGEAIEHIARQFVERSGGDLVRATPRDCWQPLLESDPSYIDAMFDAIAEKHGSVAAYAHECLGQPLDLSQRLRDLLLEPGNGG
jgi:protein-tyrosine phosphatase